MSVSIQAALLIDGGTLHGVSRRLGKGASGEESAPEFREWRFSEAAADGAGDTGGTDGAEAVGDGAASAAPTRAEAFASAVAELPVEDGAPLALPPDILVTRVLTLPAADAESLSSMVRLKMEKFAPVADDELEVDYEVIGATEGETRVFAVAVPVATLDALAADLEASGLAVTRIDSSLLCEWRSISSPPVAFGDGPLTEGADGALSGGVPSVFVIALPSGRFDFIAADEAGPVFARTLGAPATSGDLAREATLSLLDLAAERPSFATGRLVLVAPDGLGADYAEALGRAAGLTPEKVALESLAPFVQSALERDDEEGCIDIVPAAWREDEKASAARRNFIYGAIAAVAIWVVGFAVLLAVPKSIARQTAALRGEVAAVMPEYTEVADLRTRVRLIQSYEDRSHSALETLRILCERLPEGMTLGNFSYEKNDEGGSSGRRGGPGGVKITGDAADSASILGLKDMMDEEELFDAARLKGPTMDGQRRRFKFELDWRFAEVGE